MDYSKLTTEGVNARTTDLDEMSAAQIVDAMHDSTMDVYAAVAAARPAIAEAVDAAYHAISGGGRVFYLGAGTSGRLGVLDASECPPTFGVSSELVVGIIAGGDGALRNAVEGAEDNREEGARDLSLREINEGDSVVGISVAGGAEYVLGAIDLAKERGALTVGLSSNPDSPLLRNAEIAIFTDTGAEVVTGSSRMKAGSAHKMVLNMISTSVMIKLGYIYENLMINLKPTNKKLRARMIRITAELLEVDGQSAEQLLIANGFDIRRAVDSVNSTGRYIRPFLVDRGIELKAHNLAKRILREILVTHLYYLYLLILNRGGVVLVNVGFDVRLFILYAVALDEIGVKVELRNDGVVLHTSL